MAATFGRASLINKSGSLAHESSQTNTAPVVEIKAGIVKGWLIPLCFELPIAIACFYVMMKGFADPQFFIVDTSEVTSRKMRMVFNVWSKLAELPSLGVLVLFGTMTGAALTDGIVRMIVSLKGEPLFSVSASGIKGYRFWKQMSYPWDEVAKLEIVQIKAGLSKTTQMMFRGNGILGWQLNVPTNNKQELAKIYAAATAFQPRLTQK